LTNSTFLSTISKLFCPRKSEPHNSLLGSGNRGEENEDIPRACRRIRRSRLVWSLGKMPVLQSRQRRNVVRTEEVHTVQRGIFRCRRRSCSQTTGKTIKIAFGDGIFSASPLRLADFFVKTAIPFEPNRSSWRRQLRSYDNHHLEFAHLRTLVL